ncbi:Hypothetical predicted protein, partial [Xyrichtys novacula]
VPSVSSEVALGTGSGGRLWLQGGGCCLTHPSTGPVSVSCGCGRLSAPGADGSSD